jgi:hypothetical protein
VTSSRKAWWLVPLVIFLGACGPTERECGQSILLMAPLIMIVGGGMAALFRFLWKPMVPSLPLSFAQCRNAVLLMTLPCLPLAFGPSFNSEWLGMTLLAVGTSYLSFLLIAVRLCLLRRCQALWARVIYAPWLLLYPSALYFAYFGSTSAEPSDFHMQLWLFPGYFGLITGGLFVVLLLEVLTRRYFHFKRLAAEALPRPLPVATAKFR